MTTVPVVIVGGRPKHVIAGAGDRVKAERACWKLARDYREVRLIQHPQGKPEQSEELAAWRDGRRVS